MARREKKKQEISLFPFLDILACVIGNLILIITAVVLESVDTDKIATQFANEATKRETEEILKIYAELEKTLEKLKQENGIDGIDSEIKSQSIQMPIGRSPYACAYKNCIIAQNKDLETVIAIK